MEENLQDPDLDMGKTLSPASEKIENDQNERKIIHIEPKDKNQEDFQELSEAIPKETSLVSSKSNKNKLSFIHKFYVPLNQPQSLRDLEKSTRFYSKTTRAPLDRNNGYFTTDRRSGRSRQQAERSNFTNRESREISAFRTETNFYSKNGPQMSRKSPENQRLSAHNQDPRGEDYYFPRLPERPKGRNKFSSTQQGFYSSMEPASSERGGWNRGATASTNGPLPTEGAETSVISQLIGKNRQYVRTILDIENLKTQEERKKRDFGATNCFTNISFLVNNNSQEERLTSRQDKERLSTNGMASYNTLPANPSHLGRFRNQDLDEKNNLNSISREPTAKLKKEVTDEGISLSKTEPQLKTGLNYAYNSLAENLTKKTHPESIDEIKLLFKCKGLKLPSTEGMDLTDFVYLGDKERDEIKLKILPTLDESKNSPSRENYSKNIAAKLNKYFRSSKPVVQKLACAELTDWYLKESAKVQKPVKDTFSRYFDEKSSIYCYFIQGLADQVLGVRKDLGEAMQLAVTDFVDIFEEMANFVKVTVDQLQKRRQEDSKLLEKVYMEQLMNQQGKLKVHESSLSKKTNQIEVLKRAAHNMRSKLSSDYIKISELRHDLDFSYDYAYIVEAENRKLTTIISEMTSEMKKIDTQEEMIARHTAQLFSTQEASDGRKKQLRQRRELAGQEGLTKKEEFELEKVVETEEGDFEGFRMFSKGVQTEQAEISTANIEFLPIDNRRFIHTSKGVQVNVKVPTKEMITETEQLAEDLTKKSDNKFIDPYSEKSSVEGNKANHLSVKGNQNLQRRMTQKYRLENMKTLYRYSTVINDDLPSVRSIEGKKKADTNRNDLDKEPEGKYFDPKSKIRRTGTEAPKRFQILEEGKDISSESLHKSVSRSKSRSRSNQRFLQVAPASKKLQRRGSKLDNKSQKIESKADLKSISAVSKKKTFNRSESRSEFPKSRKLISLKTMYVSKPKDKDKKAQEKKLRRNSSQMQLSFGKDLDKSITSFEGMRETQLRNELIRHKQQLLLLSNKLAIHADNPEKVKLIQTRIDIVELQIEKLEEKLKIAHKNRPIDMLKHLKPGHPDNSFSRGQPRRNSRLHLQIIKDVQKRINQLISTANKVLHEVKHAKEARTRIKHFSLLKAIYKFYSEYISQYEKSLNKGYNVFPALPVKYHMYKTLSFYNSVDSVVEKKYRSILLSLKFLTKEACSQTLTQPTQPNNPENQAQNAISASNPTSSLNIDLAQNQTPLSNLLNSPNLTKLKDTACFTTFINFVGLGQVEFDHHSFETFIKLLMFVQNSINKEVMRRKQPKIELNSRECEELLSHYFEVLAKNKKEAVEGREALTKSIKASFNSSGRVDFDFVLLQVMTFDASTLKTYPLQFYYAADVDCANLDQRRWRT